MHGFGWFDFAASPQPFEQAGLRRKNDAKTQK
jgi:hypothetical protein